MTYQLDDEPDRIDVAAAIGFLTTQAYWGKQRGPQDIARQIATAWRVVGAYDDNGAMVGFARAFADGASAYLADVYVLPGHRGHGLGKEIVRTMIEAGPGRQMRWMLHTADAHGLYRQFGFAAQRGQYLERPRDAVRTDASPPRLAGKHVRLEPLRHRHIPELVEAAGADAGLYRWTPVPADQAAARAYVEAAMAATDRGEAVAYAVRRADDGAVIGSTRFWNLDYWPGQAREAPDTCEIGHTWLSAGAIRTAVNTEMKTLMLTHAFETWLVRSVCLHTDKRNERSRAAIERIGAQFEGVLRAHRLGADGLPRDSARYSITAAQWPEVKEHLAKLAARYQ